MVFNTIKKHIAVRFYRINVSKKLSLDKLSGLASLKKTFVPLQLNNFGT
jgi:hypothetical protein